METDGDASEDDSDDNVALTESPAAAAAATMLQVGSEANLVAGSESGAHEQACARHVLCVLHLCEHAAAIPQVMLHCCVLRWLRWKQMAMRLKMTRAITCP